MAAHENYLDIAKMIGDMKEASTFLTEHKAPEKLIMVVDGAREYIRSQPKYMMFADGRIEALRNTARMVRKTEEVRTAAGVMYERRVYCDACKKEYDPNQAKYMKYCQECGAQFTSLDEK